MVWISLDELVRDVRISLDENAVQSAYLEADADNLELDELIRSKLPEAARDVTESASVELLDPEPMPTEVESCEYGGMLSVPEDFLRFVSLKMAGWEKSVTVLAGEGSDIDKMQGNPYTRGTSKKPVCVLGHDALGKKVIHYYGASDKVERALYMSVPKVDDAGFLGISPLLRQAIVKRAAGLVLLSRGEAELASVFLA